MKTKIFILLTIVGICMIFISTNKIMASDYLSYENFEMSSGKLISAWSSDEYNKHFEKVSGRKFMGWSIHTVNSSVGVVFDSETFFSYYNNGYTPITYSYKVVRETKSTFGLNATGSIGINNSKSGKEFKSGLTAELKAGAAYERVDESTETQDLTFQVDPGTQVTLYMHGEGKITNGVAAKYFFWFRTIHGSFEFFRITTHYQKLEKTRI